MDEERRRVLQLVAAGTITPDEAEQLLMALDAADEDTPPPPAASPGIGTGQDRGPSNNLNARQLLDLRQREMQALGFGNLAPA